MKSILVSVIAAAGLMVAGSAMAVDMPANAGACKACHKIDGKQVGPGWKQVSEKYKGDAGAVDKIAANIIKGGEFGHNTHVKMPARGGTKLTDAEIKGLAEFIVGLK